MKVLAALCIVIAVSLQAYAMPSYTSASQEESDTAAILNFIRSHMDSVRRLQQEFEKLDQQEKQAEQVFLDSRETSLSALDSDIVPGTSLDNVNKLYALLKRRNDANSASMQRRQHWSYGYGPGGK